MQVIAYGDQSLFSKSTYNTNLSSEPTTIQIPLTNIGSDKFILKSLTNYNQLYQALEKFNEWRLNDPDLSLTDECYQQYSSNLSSAPKSQFLEAEVFKPTRADSLIFLSLRLDLISTIILEEKYVLAIFKKLLMQLIKYPYLKHEYDNACKIVRKRCLQIERFCIKNEEDYRVKHLLTSGIQIEKILSYKTYEQLCSYKSFEPAESSKKTDTIFNKTYLIQDEEAHLNTNFEIMNTQQNAPKKKNSLENTQTLEIFPISEEHIESSKHKTIPMMEEDMVKCDIREGSLENTQLLMQIPQEKIEKPVIEISGICQTPLNRSQILNREKSLSPPPKKKHDKDGLLNLDGAEIEIQNLEEEIQKLNVKKNLDFVKCKSMIAPKAVLSKKEVHKKFTPESAKVIVQNQSEKNNHRSSHSSNRDQEIKRNIIGGSAKSSVSGEKDVKNFRDVNGSSNGKSRPNSHMKSTGGWTNQYARGHLKTDSRSESPPDKPQHNINNADNVDKQVYIQKKKKIINDIKDIKDQVKKREQERGAIKKRHPMNLSGAKNTQLPTTKKACSTSKSKKNLKSEHELVDKNQTISGWDTKPDSKTMQKISDKQYFSEISFEKQDTSSSNNKKESSDTFLL